MRSLLGVINPKKKNPSQHTVCVISLGKLWIFPGKIRGKTCEGSEKFGLDLCSVHSSGSGGVDCDSGNWCFDWYECCDSESENGIFSVGEGLPKPKVVWSDPIGGSEEDARKL